MRIEILDQAEDDFIEGSRFYEAQHESCLKSLLMFQSREGGLAPAALAKIKLRWA